MINLLIADYPKLSEYDVSYLETSLKRQAKLDSVLLFDDYLHALRKSPEQVERLYQQMKIGYSTFFRDTFAFAYLKHKIIPKLLQTKKILNQKEIRIWSLACSTGQEAYSIAITLDEINHLTPSDLHFQLFASDVNEQSIHFAKAGKYPQKGIENVTLKQKDTYFTELEDSNFQLIPKIKEYINFSVFDLLDNALSTPSNSVFGGFDIIFCYNILYYYNEKELAVILKKIHRNLNLGGYLFVSNTEKNIIEKWTNYKAGKDCSIFKKNSNL